MLRTYSFRRRLIVPALLLMTMLMPASCVMKELVDETIGRTVLVYMSGDVFTSNTFANKNITWMQSSLASGMNNAALVVYVDKIGQPPCLLRVRRGRTSRYSGIDTLKVYDEQNSADPAVVREVIDDVKQFYPCDSYSLVLWSHGTGWIPSSQLVNISDLGWNAPKRDGYDKPRHLEFDFDSGTKAILVDKVKGKNVWMDIDELAGTLHDHEFDYIAFDACYMANVEVLYALRNKTDYIISSGIEIWGDGFPYFSLTRDLLNNNLVKVCEAYYQYYSQDYYDPMCGISLVKTSGLDSLARCFRKIVATNDNIKQLADTSANNVQSYDWFKNHLFYDLEDFVDKMDTEYLSEFRIQLDNCVVYKNNTPYIFRQDNAKRRKLDQYCGMSVYVPLPKFDDMGLNAAYRLTEWSRDTNY